jgi:hypothetical protein
LLDVTNRTTKKKLPNVNLEFEEVVNEYFNLVCRSKLSEQDLNRMSEIWSKAEQDKKLGGFLERIDFILFEFGRSNPQCKNEQKKDQAEKDEELQYFLSEHIEVLTTQKIKERELKINNSLSDNNFAFIILCPDGSGYQRIGFDDGGEGGTIDQWSKHKCSQCGHSYGEHIKIALDKHNEKEVPDVWFPAI